MNIKLPNLPFGQKKEKPENYLSLVFKTDKIESFIFEKIGDEIRIVSNQVELLEKSIENSDFEELLEATDKVVSQGEEEANLGDDVVKTIFGLKESWVEDNKIKREHLDILKRLCEELALKPIGFLTVSEAIVGLLQKEEGAPPSAILTDVSKNNLIISLIRGGKVIEVRQSEIHQSAAFTVDTLLKHFVNVEILPARIILLNEEEDLVQEFISHPWSKSLPFLHLPQITNLPSGFMGKALILGIAKQLGAKVMDEFDLPQKPQESSSETSKDVPEESLPIKENITDQHSNIEYVSENAQEFFGFVAGKDINKIKPPVAATTVVEEKYEEAITQEIPEDIKLKEEKKQLIPTAALILLPKVLGFLGVGSTFIKNAVTKIKLSSALQNLPIKNRRILFIAAPIILLILLLLFYFLGLKAKVLITVSPKIVEKSQNITFSTSSDFANNVIKGDFISVTEDGTTTGATTGKKQTGDKAKGTVTIFNSSTSTLTFPVKTKITSSNNLDFFTLGSVTVASRSADVPPTAGTNTVNVEASTFGTEYNLPSGTKFPSVTGNADIAAKNDNPFSGGTKKEIQVVSKDDLQKLRDTLTKQLEDKAKSDIQAKLNSSSDILPNFISESLDKENFDNPLDTEAKTVTLKGTVSYESLSYDKSEFQKYLKSVFGVNVDTKNVELSFENIKVKGTNVSGTLKVKAKIFPAINKDDLTQKIKGKSFTASEKLIMETPQIEDVRINFSPNLFFFPKTLPRINKNIQIEILENG